jgi:hypothetical protein
VIETAADVAPARRAHHDRDRRAAAVAIAQRGRLVDDLIEAARDEVGELHLGDRAVAAQRRADADADDRRLGDGRIDHAHLAELLVQSLGHAEGAAVRTDVLTQHEHLRIAAHLFGERLADRFEVRQLLAHKFSALTTKPRRARRRHEEETFWTSRFSSCVLRVLRAFVV